MLAHQPRFFDGKTLPRKPVRERAPVSVGRCRVASRWLSVHRQAANRCCRRLRAARPRTASAHSATGHSPSESTTCTAAALRTAAHSAAIFGFLPLAARVTAVSARLRAFVARPRSFRARFPELVAAWSARFTPCVSGLVTLIGRGPALHAGRCRHESRVQRAVVQGSVVVVLEVVVVVDVVVVVVMVVLALIRS